MNSIINSIFVLIIIGQVHYNSEATDCSSSFYNVNNKLLVLSDIETDANTARGICSSSEGSLARVTSQNKIIQFLKTNLIVQDLVEVNIYRNKSLYPNQLRYRSSLTNEDEQGLQDWVKPDIEKLNSFYLYKTNMSNMNFSTSVIACYVPNRGAFRTVCNQGWNFNFKLFGRTSESINAIKLYAYINNGAGTTHFFLNDQENIEGFKPASSIPFHLGYLFIPDISVFIGARWDVNQSNWIWNNGTIVNDPRFLTTNSSVCQQMSLPLTYDDGINLHPKQCDEEAHFLCQFNFDIEVDPVSCNGTTLNVSWNELNLKQITNNPNNLVVDIYVNETFQRRASSVYDKPIILTGLSQRNLYSVKAVARTLNCNKTILTTSSKLISTSFGVPDPVNNATALNQNDSCVIQWPFNAQQFNHTLDYKVLTNHPTKKEYIISTASLQLINGSVLQTSLNNDDYQSDSTVHFKIQAISCEGESEISSISGSCNFFSNSTTRRNPINSIVIVIVVVVTMILLVLLGIGFIYRKYKNKKEENISSVTNLNEAGSFSKEAKLTKNGKVESLTENILYEKLDVQIRDENNVIEVNNIYENQVDLYKKDEIEKLVDAFIEESSNMFEDRKKKFEKICVDSLQNEPEHRIAKLADNLKKNRFKNIYPYDSSLVVLDKEMYINASYIEGYQKNKQFIATQGPKYNTLNDFWEMVWKEDSSVIVMLCNCVEKEKTKCEMYWPLKGATVSYEIIKAKCEEEFDLGGIIKRIFIVNKNEEERTITQFHYVSWPDHDIPLTTSGMYRLRNLVSNEHLKNQSKGRIIVHCSAGVGRTGTYIAIDNLIEEFHETGKVDVYSAVMKMRRNRKDMVQNKSQYLFVYKVVLESLVFPNTEVSAKNLSEFVSRSKSMEKVDKEYEYLFTFSAGQSEESVYENYHISTSMNEVNRVNLRNIDGTKISVDAHYIEDDGYPSFFVASSSPIKGRESEFIDSLVQTNSKLVVCLEYLNSDKILSRLKKEGDVLDVENYRLSVNNINNYNSYIQINVAVENTKNKMNFTFNLINFHSWREDFSPPRSLFLSDVITKAKTMMEQTQFSNVYIYCRDGKTRTGLFLVLASVIEQIKRREIIDVFRAVKDLRDMRPGAIQSLDLYKLCYQLVRDFMSSNVC